jgi:hypothetical protein
MFPSQSTSSNGSNSVSCFLIIYLRVFFGQDNSKKRREYSPIMYAARGTIRMQEPAPLFLYLCCICELAKLAIRFSVNTQRSCMLVARGTIQKMDHFFLVAGNTS